MLIVSTCLWDANETSMASSRCYDETWAEKLYRGFARNLSVPFRFVVFTDRERAFSKPIKQMPITRRPIHYGACVEPFVLDEPMIFIGLDTVIVGNCDKFAIWCMEHPGKLALPKHPYEDWSINGVVLCGSGNRRIFDEWNGENDMDWMRTFPHARIDTLWAKKIVSYKAHVAKQGLSNKARIVYFHGTPKADTLKDRWVLENWR